MFSFKCYGQASEMVGKSNATFLPPDAAPEMQLRAKRLSGRAFSLRRRAWQIGLLLEPSEEADVADRCTPPHQRSKSTNLQG